MRCVIYIYLLLVLVTVEIGQLGPFRIHKPVSVAQYHVSIAVLGLACRA